VNRTEKWKIIAGIVTIDITIMLAQIVSINVSVLIKSAKLPSDRRKMFADRMANGNLFLPKGFFARLKNIITDMNSSIYENIQINVIDIFNIIINKT
jgi:hypothetical protein